MTENNDWQWFVHIPFLSEEQCDKLLEQIKSEGGWNTGEVMNAITGEQKVSKYRKCDELFLHQNRNEKIKGDYNWILKKLDTIVRLTNDRIWHFDIEEPSGDFRALKYNVGSKFGWHSGTDRGHYSLNKITCLIQLSDRDDFDGCDLHFAFQNLAEFPEDNLGEKFFKAPYKKGSLFMFPSFANHMVTELTGGERYIIRETYIGEPFR